MTPGLDETRAVGRCGGYHPWADHANAIQLATCVARDLDLHAVTADHSRRWLGGPVLPLDHSRTHLGSGWTGRAYRYAWADGGFDVHLRSTLPGPLFIVDGTKLHWRWAVDNGVPRARSLPGGKPFLCAWSNADVGPVVLLENWGVPTLVVASTPIRNLHWVSHENLTLEFDEPGTSVIFVPLLDAADVPTDVGPWLDLVAAPPVGCREEFEVRESTVVTRQHFVSPTGEPTRVAPIPAVTTFSPLQNFPASRRLITGLLGPYRIVDGASVESEIAMDWARAAPDGGQAVPDDNLSPIPAELAYAGDVTWEPGTPMDQLLALRVWAPLAGICPPRIWDDVVPQLTPPTADALRESLAVITEPVSGLRWAKEARLFEVAGDVAYDSDWYNGFELSGLGRAVNCADARIAEPARTLAAEAKPERALLTNYFQIFHDWELGAAWTDPRGTGWNVDCSHNGLEGLLAESSLRESEGDTAGADFVFYLAAKTASALLAAEHLGDHQLGIGFRHGGEPLGPAAQLEDRAALWAESEIVVGMEGFHLARGVVAQTTAARNPYFLAGNFPEFCVLQRTHGRMERYREIARTWADLHPARYEDWACFYCGDRLDPDASAMHSQEDRVQAAVMYHLAPDVAFRLWVLGENGADVEARFRTPLNLVEQLWCRSGTTW